MFNQIDNYMRKIQSQFLKSLSKKKIDTKTQYQNYKFGTKIIDLVPKIDTHLLKELVQGQNIIYNGFPNEIIVMHRSEIPQTKLRFKS